MNEEKIANIINKEGYYILKNYVLPDRCKKIIDNIKKCKQFNKGEGNDLRQSNFENYCQESKKFLEDSFLLKIGEHVLGHKPDRKKKRCQLGILEHKNNNECSGGGWHVDNHNPQYKAILYLTDVNENNGPFSILSPPVKSRVIEPASKNRDTRFSDKSVEENFKDRIKILTGEKGDVILVNTSYIHRGTIIKEGKRLSLTNYYYD